VPHVFWKKCTRGVFKISCETIKNGNKVGRSVSNQRSSPFLDDCKTPDGNTSKKMKKKLKNIKGKIRFN
jgi:hypothetical protein